MEPKAQPIYYKLRLNINDDPGCCVTHTNKDSDSKTDIHWSLFDYVCTIFKHKV
jgi:hypothetical protein